ncbi:SIMPL domain-containing protein [Hydrogenophaga sp.]|uniref:SIMPL domain-containing protein n=1 Tax=Hydrogenophaga sp. TaxID=1904254 RepID=UPI0035B4F104
MTVNTQMPSPRFASFRHALVIGLAFGALTLAPVANAQTVPVPSNVVQLQASGSVDVPQDWLTVRLSTTREASDAATVQNQLKQATEAALASLRAQVRPGDFEVRTGSFGVYPRYASAGKMAGWHGSAEVIIEGRDIERISAAAGKVSGMTVGQMGFSLSREARRKLESQVQAMAIDRFKARAAEIAQGFGFTGYQLREVSVSAADEPGRPIYARPMAMEAKAAMSDAPIPVEAGTSTVSVTVSGSVQLR